MKYGLSEEQLAEIIAFIKRYPEVKEAILFGSRAIDTYKEASDIDIAIKGEKVNAGLAATIKFDLEEDTFLPFFFDVIAYPTITNEALIKHIDTKGVRLLGDVAAGEWVEGVLSDIAEIVMGQSPDGESCSDNTDDTPLLNGPTEFGIKYPIPVQFTDNPKRFSREEDILFCVRGSTTGRMNWANQAYAIGRGLAAIRHKEGIDYKYFVRGIIDFNLPLLLSSATGSTFPNISKSQLENLEISLPPLPEQKAIAAVLSSLDDKIDLLHRQNKTLEAMAETLFRQWFIEEAKEDWEEVVLGSLFEISSGKGLKKEQLNDNGLYPVLGANGKIGKTNDFLFDEKLLFTGRVGTLGNIFIVNKEKVWLSDNTLIFRKITFFYFIYFTLKTANLADYNAGSTQPLIRQSDIKEIPVLLPCSKLLTIFESQSEQYFQKQSINKKQIQILEKLRDNLLPKLMSGEVRVSYET
jgi:type I restriction enzyme S subunit